MRTMVIIVAAWFAVMGANAQEQEDNSQQQWHPVVESQDPGDVRTWVKAVPGASVKAFRGEVEVASSPLQVLAVLDGVEAFPQWVFQCKAAERVPGKGIYLRFNGIWPVADRDATLNSKVSVMASSVVIETNNLAGMLPERDGYVRIPELNNRFEVVQLHNGGSRIIFETFVDPGGMVPGFISNIVSKKGPLVTLNGIKKMLADRGNTPVSLDQLSSIYQPVRSDLEQLLE